MKDNSELNRQKYSNFLYEALASEGNSREKCCELIDKYTQLTDAGVSSDGAFGIIYAGYGSCNARDVLSRATRFVHDELETFNKTGPKVSLNKNRLAEVVKRFNQNLDKCCIEINGKTLSKDEIEKLHLPIPANVTQDVFTATASQKICGVNEFVLTIRH